MSRKFFEVSSLERGRSNVGSYRLKSLEWTFGRVSSLDLKERLVPTAAAYTRRNGKECVGLAQLALNYIEIKYSNQYDR